MAIGRKTGGRQKGTLNKATVALERRVKEETSKAARLRPNSLDELRKMAMVLTDLVVRERNKGEPGEVNVVDAEGKVTGKRRVGMDAAFVAELAERSGRMWAKMAEFEWPRMSSVTLHQQPLDLSVLTDEQLSELKRIVTLAALDRDDRGGRAQTTH